MNKGAKQARGVQIDIPRLAWWGAGIVLQVGILFSLAFAIDVATDRQYSLYLGSAAILGSVWVVLPRIRPAVTAFAGYVTVWALFNLARAFADESPLGIGGTGAVGRVEELAFGGTLPTIRLQDRFHHGNNISVWEVGLAAVHGSFFVVPFVVSILIWWKRREQFPRYTWATASCFALGLIGYFLLPTQPPWMSHPEHVTRITFRALGTEHSTSAHYGQGLSGADDSLWFEPNHLAAMPSMHVAIVVLLIPFARLFGRSAHVLAGLYAAAMTVSVVYLGEHFLVDAMAGWLVAIAAWRITSIFLNDAGRAETSDEPAHRHLTGSG